jgi:hypothetical protein
MFKLPDPSGKLCNVCLMSNCQPPFNACAKTTCIPSKRDGRKRNPYLHIDLAELPWSEAPESVFASVVEYLKKPGVNRHVTPSQCWLKAKTPGAAGEGGRSRTVCLSMTNRLSNLKKATLSRLQLATMPPSLHSTPLVTPRHLLPQAFPPPPFGGQASSSTRAPSTAISLRSDCLGIFLSGLLLYH